MSSSEQDLTVAITGPTGTFGFGLVPLLQADDRIGTVVGIARRPFDPRAHGWSKMGYRQGDVRDAAALEEAFTGADVVVHLAFLIMSGTRETTRAINVEGTLNAFRAAAAVGARRFVYASSIAAYGFHRDNPVGMTEEWPTRSADRLFYAQEKAELEQLLEDEAARHPGTALYLLRPPIVLGPQAVGAKAELPAPLVWLGRKVLGRDGRLPVPLPVLVPDLPIQFIHQDDVGQALLQCVVGGRTAGGLQHRGRRRAQRAGRRARARPAARAAAGRPDPRRRPGAVPVAAAAVGRRVGGGGEPPRRDGHDPGQGRARLDAAPLGARRAPGDLPALISGRPTRPSSVGATTPPTRCGPCRGGTAGSPGRGRRRAWTAPRAGRRSRRPRR